MTAPRWAEMSRKIISSADGWDVHYRCKGCADNAFFLVLASDVSDAFDRLRHDLDGIGCQCNKSEWPAPGWRQFGVGLIAHRVGTGERVTVYSVDRSNMTVRVGPVGVDPESEEWGRWSDWEPAANFSTETSNV